MNLDATTDNLWTYVTGTEAWFQSMGSENGIGILENVALTIKAMNAPLQKVTGGSFVTTSPKHEGITGGEFINIVYANLAAGMDLSQTLNGTQDLDAVLNIGGKNVVDMTDTNGLGYANYIVGKMKANSMLSSAPIFVSSEGGIGFISLDENQQFVMNTNVYTTIVGAAGLGLEGDAQMAAMAAAATELFGALGTTPQAVIEQAIAAGAPIDPSTLTDQMTILMTALNVLDTQNTTLLGQGDFITLYYNNMGILLQYNLDK